MSTNATLRLTAARFDSACPASAQAQSRLSPDGTMAAATVPDLVNGTPVPIALVNGLRLADRRTCGVHPGLGPHRHREDLVALSDDHGTLLDAFDRRLAAGMLDVTASFTRRALGTITAGFASAVDAVHGRDWLITSPGRVPARAIADLTAELSAWADLVSSDAGHCRQIIAYSLGDKDSKSAEWIGFMAAVAANQRPRLAPTDRLVVTTVSASTGTHTHHFDGPLRSAHSQVGDAYRARLAALTTRTPAEIPGFACGSCPLLESCSAAALITLPLSA